jgi:CheY-like chemotaxis protein
VLVVDDEPLVLRAISRALSEDHEVVCESDPRAVMPRLARGESFDVLFCDLMMPGLSGMDLHAEISAAHPDVADRIVFVTGGAFTSAARSFLERVSNRRLDKPFRGELLRDLVREVACREPR